jgi:hypothetical protein
MKKNILWLAAILVLSLNACVQDDEKVGTVNIRVKAKYKTSTFALGESYPYADNIHKIKLNRFSILLSPIQLLGDQDYITLSDNAHLLDFSDNHYDIAHAVNGESILLQKVPVGSYDHLVIGLGVPAALNNKTPADFDAGTPLADEAHYWDTWASYIHAKIEGSTLATDGTPVATLRQHTGTNDTYTIAEIHLTTPLTVAEAQENILDLTLDVEKIFYNATDTLNLLTEGENETNPATEGSVQRSKELMTRWAAAIHQ